MKKREFIKRAGLVAALAGFGLTLESCSEDEEPAPSGGSGLQVDLSVSPFSRLKDPDSWLLHPDENILLVNVGGSISAFSSACTHSGCARDWSFNGEFVCGCHGSRFSTSGQVTNGPATSALARLSVSREGDVLILG